MMILRCMNSDFNKWMREPSISKKSSSSNPVKTTVLEAKLLSLRSPCKICMDQEKVKVPFTSSSITWKLIMKNSFSFLRLLVNTKTAKILISWEKLSTYQIKASKTFAKLSTSNPTKLPQEELPKKMVMQTNGFQPKLSRRSRRFKQLLIPKWLRPVFHKSFTSSTLSGEISWEKKMSQ